MTNETCGYQGHVCSEYRIQFISRYRGENDYCVSGRRVGVSDNGKTRYAQPGDVDKIRLFELDKYAQYLQWRAENHAMFGEMPLQPFTFPL